MLELHTPDHYCDGSIRENVPGYYVLDEITDCERRVKRVSPRYRLGVTMPKGIMMLYSATKDYGKDLTANEGWTMGMNVSSTYLRSRNVCNPLTSLRSFPSQRQPWGSTKPPIKRLPCTMIHRFLMIAHEKRILLRKGAFIQNTMTLCNHIGASVQEANRNRVEAGFWSGHFRTINSINDS